MRGKLVAGQPVHMLSSARLCCLLCSRRVDGNSARTDLHGVLRSSLGPEVYSLMTAEAVIRILNMSALSFKSTTLSLLTYTFTDKLPSRSRSRRPLYLVHSQRRQRSPFECHGGRDRVGRMLDPRWAKPIIHPARCTWPARCTVCKAARQRWLLWLRRARDNGSPTTASVLVPQPLVLLRSHLAQPCGSVQPQSHDHLAVECATQVQIYRALDR